MIVEKEYKRNKFTGEIIKRETVEVICDKCGKRWETFYSNRKRKILEEDLCSVCRGKLAILKRAISLNDLRWRKPNRKKTEITCKNCGIKKARIPSLINQGDHFCCLGCREEYWFKTKYGHLELSFKNNPNEVAYLIGMIMGDGHIRKCGKKTMRVGIAFDYTGKWTSLMDLMKAVLDKLQINWFEQGKSHNHCKMVGFILPNALLEKYGICYYGDKFKIQPFPSEDIVKNINYVAGLLNSDGCAHKNAYGISYRFNNTVDSIIESFTKCLSLNKIDYSLAKHKGRFDKRTNNIGKDFHIVYINEEKNTKMLREKCNFKIKE